VIERYKLNVSELEKKLLSEEKNMKDKEEQLKKQ
jgi:hypothetical protein